MVTIPLTHVELPWDCDQVKTTTPSIKLRSYYDLTGEGDKYNIIKSWTEPFDHIITEGPYKAIYKRWIPNDHFGLHGWKHCRPYVSATFYKNDVELFKKDVCKNILFFHKFNEGEVRFIIKERDGINLYSFSDSEPIRIKSKICIGPDCIVGFQKVSPKYALALTEEMCTYSPFGSIFDLDGLMFQPDTETQRPYNNFRMAMPIYNDDYIAYVPIEATPTGFVIWDVKNKKKLATELSYDDAYADKFYFWEDDAEEKQNTLLQSCLTFITALDL